MEMAAGLSGTQSPERRIYLCDSRRSALAAIVLSGHVPGVLVPTTSVAAHQLAKSGEKFFGVSGDGMWSDSIAHPERRLSLYRYFSSELVEVLCRNGRQRDDAEVIVDTFVYHLKLTIDYPAYVSVLLENCVTSSTAEVMVPRGSNIGVDDMGLILPECSLLEAIIPGIAGRLGLTATTYDAAVIIGQVGSSSGDYSGRHGVIERIRRKFRRIIRGAFGPFTFSLAVGLAQLRVRRALKTGSSEIIIGWNCREIRAIGTSVSNTRLRLMNVRCVAGPRVDTAFGAKAADEFDEAVQQSGKLSTEEMAVLPVLKPVVAHICARFDWLVSAAGSLTALFNRATPSQVMVNTMTSLEIEIPAIRLAARRSGIPVGCWMHGGYGAYEDAVGYDISDLRLADFLVAYGPQSARAIRSPSIQSRASGARNDLRVISLGAPSLAERYLQRNEVPQSQERPRVVFCLGPRYLSNRFYFGYQRPSVEVGLCVENIAIASALAHFSTQFEIVIKDYPKSELAFFWSEFCSANNLTFVGGDQAFEDVIRNASCVILTWVSTTFIEVLLSGRPFLLWDDSCLRTDARRTLEEYGGFTDSIVGFDEFLRHWLTDHRFRQLRPEVVKSAFIDSVSSEFAAKQLVAVAQSVRASLNSSSP